MNTGDIVYKGNRRGEIVATVGRIARVRFTPGKLTAYYLTDLVTEADFKKAQAKAKADKQAAERAKNAVRIETWAKLDAAERDAVLQSVALSPKSSCWRHAWWANQSCREVRESLGERWYETSEHKAQKILKAAGYSHVRGKGWVKE